MRKDGKGMNAINRRRTKKPNKLNINVQHRTSSSKQKLSSPQLNNPQARCNQPVNNPVITLTPNGYAVLLSLKSAASRWHTSRGYNRRSACGNPGYFARMFSRLKDEGECGELGAERSGLGVCGL